jgi:hypothetical protein
MSARIVVVFVEIPHESVHHKAVCTPGDSFHQKKGAECDKYACSY